MNARQKKFCESYAICMNATQAAESAGYSKRTAYSQGARLMKNVDIQNYINEIIKNNMDLPDKKEIREYWTSVMRDKTQKQSVRMSASVNLAKSLFMFNADISSWED